MTQILMRLPSELHATIRIASRGVNDVSEFISICEEIIDSSLQKKNAWKTNYSSSYRRDEQPQKTGKDNSQERKRSLTVPLQSSSKDLNPKEKGLCFKCKSPWNLGHKCKKTQVNIIEQEEASSETEESCENEYDLGINSQEENSINILECFPDCEVLLNGKRENCQTNLVDIQDAEYMHDPGVSNTYHCPAQCSARINNQIIKLVIDTGAGGCVVSSKYLTTIDPDWESKVSALHQNLCQVYGSQLKPRGMYNTDVIFPHPRRGIRCRVK